MRNVRSRVPLLFSTNMPTSWEPARLNRILVAATTAYSWKGKCAFPTTTCLSITISDTCHAGGGTTWLPLPAQFFRLTAH